MSSTDQTPQPRNNHSTIHHIPFRSEVRDEIVYDDREPTNEEFETLYTPAETVMGTTDPGEAYKNAQGWVVNETQQAIHMVRSASAGDIIETNHPDGSTTYHLVSRIGFKLLEFPEAS